jgi:hypothetical protein
MPDGPKFRGLRQKSNRNKKVKLVRVSDYRGLREPWRDSLAK